MKRRISWLVCALLALATVFTLAACVSTDVHQHSYSDVWSKNETNHWHAATCTDGEDCKTAQASVAAHADADKNSVCDVCGYDYNHTHTYAETLSSDENGHWYAVTCGCSIDVKDQADHTDANNDGICDTCAYASCEHTYVTDAWAIDETNHWHAASCGHSVVTDKAAHDFNEVDLCKTCGYVRGGTVSVAGAVAMGEYYENLVNGGTILFAQDTYSKNETLINFQLGNLNSMYNETNLTYGSVTNNYYSLYNGAIFGVTEYVEGENVTVQKAYEPESALIDGYGFSELFGYDDDAEDTFYGTTAMVTGLYEMGKATTNGSFAEYVINFEGKPMYIFSFYTDEVYTGYDAATDSTNNYLYRIEVAVTLGEGYNYETVTVSSAQYNCEADAVAAEEGDVAPVTYHTVKLVPNVVYEYTVAQTVGDRTLTPKYDAATVLMSDFNLVDASGNVITDTITMEAGASQFFGIAVVAPTTAVPELDNIEVSADGLSAFFWDDLMLSAYGAGEYTLTVKSTLAEKTYQVVVTAPATSSLTPSVIIDAANTVDGNAYTVYGDADGVTDVTFGAIANAYADASFTAMLSPAAAMFAQLTPNDDGTYTVSITADMGGYAEVAILLTSTVNPDVTAELVINVEPAPSVADVLNGEYDAMIGDMRFSGYEDLVNVVFTPETEGALTGTMVLTLSYSAWDMDIFGYVDYTYTETYTYAYADGVLTTTYVSGDYTEVLGYTFAIDAQYNVTVTWAGGSVAMNPVVPVDASDLMAVINSYVAWESDATNDYGWPAYAITTGEYACLNDMNASAYPYISIAADNATGVITITYLEAYNGALVGATYAYDYVNGTIVATLADGSVVTFVGINY